MSSRPNILFLFSDEHTYRGLSLLDEATGEPVQTPTLDQLARNGTYFESAYCQAALCTPSRICLLTGKSPMGSGGWENNSYLKPENTTLPAALAAAGYATCLVGKMHLGGDRQFVGFQHRPYGDLSGRTGHQGEPLEGGWNSAMRSRTKDAGVTQIPETLLQEQNVVGESIAFLREQRHAHPEQPWFLCASFSRPHFPLTAPRRFFERYWPDGVTPPRVGRSGDTADHPMTLGMAKGFRTEEIDETEKMRARAAYFACIDYLDEILNDMLTLLERDGLLDNTIVVYCADHGEMAGEHGLWWKNSWHEASVRVPWIVQTPEQRRGEAPSSRLETPVSLADLFPTLCGLCDVPAPPDLDGRDLSDAIRNGREPEVESVFVDNPTPRWGEGTEHRVARRGRWKYVAFRSAPDLLFNLEDDPLEQVNLVGRPEHESTAREMREIIDESWDFDRAEEQRRLDREEATRHELPDGMQRWGNCYLTPDRRIIAADTPLYDPVVLTSDPAQTFLDTPENLKS